MNAIKNTHQKESLNYLKAFAITLVVAHHVIDYAVLTDLHPIIVTLKDLIQSIHVPLFFLIAGYLCHEQNLTKFFSKKIERIIFPFITFTTLKLIYTNLISNEYAHGATLPDQIIDAFLYGSLYWFIYPMFIFFLCAPLLWKSKRINIVIFVTLLLINGYVGYPTSTFLQLWPAFFNACFFVAGILIQQYEKQLTALVEKYNRIFVLICLSIIAYLVHLLYTGQTYYSFPVRVLLAFSEMYLIWRGAKKLPENITALKIMGKYSLQIMFFDSFFKVVLFLILNKLAIANPITALLTIPVNILLSCIACFIIKKIPFIRKLFGL